MVGELVEVVAAEHCPAPDLDLLAPCGRLGRHVGVHHDLDVVVGEEVAESGGKLGGEIVRRYVGHRLGYVPRSEDLVGELQ